MLFSLLKMAIDITTGILGFTFLLRFWIQIVRTVPPLKITDILLRMTDWLIKPLRKAIPVKANYDWATLIAAISTAFISAIANSWLIHYFSSRIILFLAAVSLLHWIVYGFMGMLIIETIFSWINPFHPIAFFIADMTRPILQPIRRIIPPLGGIDFSGLIAFFLLQFISGIFTNYILAQLL